MESYYVDNKEYTVIRFLGHGKGGYSYLVSYDNQLFTLKKIHHEPCTYYTFSNKIQSEFNDYNTLLNVGILMPQMYYCDFDQEIIIKEYIEGENIFDLVCRDCNINEYIVQMREIAERLKQNNLNIDYFPTNFIVKNNQLYYIDYECNSYMEEYDFENWGINYWYKSQQFLELLKNR